MIDLQALFETIDHLQPDELEEVRRYVEQRSQETQHPADEDVEAQIAALHAALAEFREGLTQDELNGLVEAMNVNYTYPMKELATFDWLDELPEGSALIYLLDTNAISDLILNTPNVVQRTDQHLASRDTVGITQPVYFELMRGLLWKKAPKKLATLQNKIIPQLTSVALVDDDWTQAAHFWASAVTAGRQLSDVDLLLAAIAHRLDAIIVSSDADFDALAVKRENWRV